MARGTQTRSTGAGRHDVEIARIEERKASRLADLRYGAVRTAIRVLGFVAVAFFFFKGIQVFAGVDTSFSAVVRGVLDVKVDRWGAWLLAGLFGGGWYRERRLRQRTIADQGKYIAQLEGTIDPERSRSGLLETGKPRKEDLDAP